MALFFVFTWTTFRFISNGINFDVVGQIGLAGQWRHGLHEGATLGPTNYVLKMPLYALVQAIPEVSPRAKLYILALICNVATFCALFWVGGKILDIARIKNRLLWYLGFVWLAVIAGRVFWMDYANSRNLELAAGLLTAWLLLRALQKPSVDRLAILGAVASLTFFADPLQLYTTGMGMGIYLAILIISRLWHGRSFAAQLWTCVSLAVAALISKVLFWLSTILLNISYLPTPDKNTSFVPLSQLQGFLHAIARLFDIDVLTKPIGAVSLRHIVGMLLISGVLWLLVQHRKTLQSAEALLLVCITTVTMLVYVASGHAGQAGTERYIAMVAVCIPLLFGFLGDAVPKRRQPLAVTLWFGVVALAMALQLGAIAQAWPTRFTKDAPIEALASYAKTTDTAYIVSGRQYANPADYLAERPGHILPLLCTPAGSVVIDDLFYDRATWRQVGRTGKALVLAIPSGGIKAEASVCSQDSLIQQFGQPARIEPIPDFGTGLIYTDTVQTLQANVLPRE
ncbi:hypothetical protein KBC77_04555 [Candidatus Saccharibacteria bacterium]|nr:hypothetical protein [Candidatus Saccharibacteria bacterium]